MEFDLFLLFCVIFRLRSKEGSEGDGEGEVGAEEKEAAAEEEAAMVVGGSEEMELHIQRIMARIDQFTEKVLIECPTID